LQYTAENKDELFVSGAGNDTISGGLGDDIISGGGAATSYTIL